MAYLIFALILLFILPSDVLRFLLVLAILFLPLIFTIFLGWSCLGAGGAFLGAVVGIPLVLKWAGDISRGIPT